ncbi:hypothetical protein GCM10010149_88360 [Nonomuraea roseoviolacea subsp. roseoviolacea]|uniref:hypothetical protein n=1 Tax=Nonomuraea roseoviolacea TaxID=103837 RepID=UPI0031D8F742
MFKLEFKTSNAAFDDENDGNAQAEIKDILTDLAAKVYDGYTEGVIKDTNGNRIGSWSFERD